MATLAEIMARKGGAPLPQSVETKSPVIRAGDERAKMAADIKQTLDASAPLFPKGQPPAPQRELGALLPVGETIPMDHPPQDASEAAWEWFRSLHSFESDMGIVIDPIGEHAWLAVQARAFDQPLLILRLPLFNRPECGNPF